MLVFRSFQWEIGHNTLQQSWITIKGQHFHPKKSDLGPVHLDQISDKLDYLSCPSGQFFFFIFLASDKLLAALGSGIGTCSFFFHSLSLQHNVSNVICPAKFCLTLCHLLFQNKLCLMVCGWASLQKCPQSFLKALHIWWEALVLTNLYHL